MFRFPDHISRSVHDSVIQEVALVTIVDVSVIAERVRFAHTDENIAREDIEMLVMRQAQLFGLPMLLGSVADSDGVNEIFMQAPTMQSFRIQ